MTAEPITLKSHGMTDVGKLRDHNEDSYLDEKSAGLYVVCDGMGGHAGGEVASGIAVETINEFIHNQKEGDWPFGLDDQQALDGERLRNAALLANQRITEHIEKEPWLARMGTTMVSALVAPDGTSWVANIGDSRAYLWQSGTLRQITSDHSWVNEQVQRGVLSSAEAASHPLKNVITRALGARDVLPVDLMEEKLQPGDALLLCSDGLTGMLSDEAIAAILGDLSLAPEEVCRRLVEGANENGGEDNITVVLVRATAA
jgi:serine/threonine protein phosphatase PrpC